METLQVIILTSHWLTSDTDFWLADRTLGGCGRSTCLLSWLQNWSSGCRMVSSQGQGSMFCILHTKMCKKKCVLKKSSTSDWYCNSRFFMNLIRHELSYFRLETKILFFIPQNIHHWSRWLETVILLQDEWRSWRIMEAWGSRQREPRRSRQRNPSRVGWPQNDPPRNRSNPSEQQQRQQQQQHLVMHPPPQHRRCTSPPLIMTRHGWIFFPNFRRADSGKNEKFGCSASDFKN